MKFRKKPVVIEAVQWLGNMGAVIQLVGHDLPTAGNQSLTIETLEGFMRVDFGDWIIRGVKGEFYPVKPEVFALTYGSVE